MTSESLQSSIFKSQPIKVTEASVAACQVYGPQTHHDDADTDADPADDVQFVVEHLVDGGRTALKEEPEEKKTLKRLILVAFKSSN